MQKNFQSLQERARLKYNQGNYSESLQYFLKAKQAFTVHDNLDDFIYIFIELSRIYLLKKDYKQAKHSLGIGMSNLEKFSKLIPTDKLDKQKMAFNLNSQLGECHLQEAQNTTESIEKYLSLIDSSLKYFTNSLEIALQVLLTEKFKQKQQEQEWQVLYSNSVINTLNPILTEADKFEDAFMFQLILKITEKLSNFYELSQHRSEHKRNYSKCCYYRAAALKKLHRNGEVENLLKKDYEFCKKNKYLSDLQKSRSELIDFYVKAQRMGDAKKYLNSDSQKEIFYKISKNLQRIKELEVNVKSVEFRENSKSTQIGVIKELFEMTIAESWWRRAYSFAKQIAPLFRDHQILYIINYYAAYSCYENDDFKAGYSYCEAAQRYSQQNTVENLEILLLKAQYQEQLGQNIEALLDECIELQKKLSQDLQVEQIVKNIKSGWKRGKRHTNFEAVKGKQQELLTKMRNNNKKQGSAQQNQNSNNFKVSFMMKNTSKSPAVVLQQKYRKLCAENQCAVRNYILENIKNKGQLSIDFNQFYNFPQKQLLMLIELNQTPNWDFRNSKISRSFIENLNNSTNISSIKTLKIKNNILKIESLLKLLQKMQQLKELHLQKLVSLSRIENFPLPNLQVLKLKNCNLSDEFITLIQNCHSLTELNFSKNQIQGHNLHKLNCLQLQKLNLSFNPLRTYHPSKLLSKFKIKGLRVVLSQSQQIFGQQLFNSKIIDISENSDKNLLRLLEALHNYCVNEQILELPNLTEIRMRRVNVNKDIFQILSVICSLADKLKMIDLRFSHYDQGVLEHFRHYILSTEKKIEINNKAPAYSPYNYNSDCLN